MDATWVYYRGMYESGMPAETNSIVPSSEERLWVVRMQRAIPVGHVVLSDACPDMFRPDTNEEAESRAKELVRARLDFQLAWDARTAEIEAGRQIKLLQGM